MVTCMTRVQQQWQSRRKNMTKRTKDTDFLENYIDMVKTDRDDYIIELRERVTQTARVAMLTGFVYGVLSAFIVVLLTFILFWW